MSFRVTKLSMRVRRYNCVGLCQLHVFVMSYLKHLTCIEIVVTCYLINVTVVLLCGVLSQVVTSDM